MSRGPGKIELAIVAALDGDPDNAFTTDDLCRRTYSTNRIEKKHRVAVTRAALKVQSQRRFLQCYRTEGLGGTYVWFNGDRVLSYAMARLKADCFNKYQSNDPRIPGRSRSTENDLRAKLAPGGEGHKLVVPGGPWWQDVELFRAQLAGDAPAVQHLNKQRGAENTELGVRATPS